MSIRRLSSFPRVWLALSCLAACSPPQETTDAGVDAGPTLDAGRDAGFDAGFPALGVYTLKLDGGPATLLVGTQTREWSHPRRLVGTPWVVATRYGQDPDLNGLALEDEAGIGAFYEGTQIIAFSLDAPATPYVLAGSAGGGYAANPSWTDDRRVLFMYADAGVMATELRRLAVSLATVPAVTGTEVLSLPAALAVPVDPHQTGLSDATGRITFSALYFVTTGTTPGWARPVWMVPANGITSAAQLRFLGCPICPAQGGCCTFPTLAEVLGTNDPRISHGAGDVTWMQQHPAISFTLGSVTVYPLRQVKVPLDGGPQVDLVQSGVDPMTLQSYPEWSADDSTLAYWSIEFTTGVPRYHLDVMTPDGGNRRRLPLSPELCPQHPSFLDRDTLIFNARRAKADAGFSCDVTLMRP